MDKTMIDFQNSELAQLEFKILGALDARFHYQRNPLKLRSLWPAPAPSPVVLYRLLTDPVKTLLEPRHRPLMLSLPETLRIEAADLYYGQLLTHYEQAIADNSNRLNSGLSDFGMPPSDRDAYLKQLVEDAIKELFDRSDDVSALKESFFISEKISKRAKTPREEVPVNSFPTASSRSDEAHLSVATSSLAKNETQSASASSSDEQFGPDLTAQRIFRRKDQDHDWGTPITTFPFTQLASRDFVVRLQQSGITTGTELLTALVERRGISDSGARRLIKHLNLGFFRKSAGAHLNSFSAGLQHIAALIGLDAADLSSMFPSVVTPLKRLLPQDFRQAQKEIGVEAKTAAAQIKEPALEQVETSRSVLLSEQNVFAEIDGAVFDALPYGRSTSRAHVINALREQSSSKSRAYRIVADVFSGLVVESTSTGTIFSKSAIAFALALKISPNVLFEKYISSNQTSVNPYAQGELAEGSAAGHQLPTDNSIIGASQAIEQIVSERTATHASHETERQDFSLLMKSYVQKLPQANVFRGTRDLSFGDFSTIVSSAHFGELDSTKMMHNIYQLYQGEMSPLGDAHLIPEAIMAMDVFSIPSSEVAAAIPELDGNFLYTDFIRDRFPNLAEAMRRENLLTVSAIEDKWPDLLSRQDTIELLVACHSNDEAAITKAAVPLFAQLTDVSEAILSSDTALPIAFRPAGGSGAPVVDILDPK